MRTCVVYIHGLDRRRINDADTPFLASRVSPQRAVVVEPIPSNELVSTVFTGAWPHEHGHWQVALDPSHPRPRTLCETLVDFVPDCITTTLQCVRYQFDRSYEMPTVPPRRRRRFEFHRFKYYGWALGKTGVREVGGMPTLFDVLRDRCRFQFAKDMTGTRDALAAVPSDTHDVDFVQTYGLDQMQHWGLDRPDIVADAMRQLDQWLADTADRCARLGVAMLIFSDHGQEAVHGHLDLMATLRATGVPERDYTVYIEAQSARFWFHTPDARERITQALAEVNHARVVTNDDLRQHHIDFPDTRYGELYLYSDQGWIFFPHDFYHPLVNRVMGWTEREVMAPRLRDPRQRGYHGHMPGHPAEDGFLAMADDRWQPATTRATLIDIAPTVLALAGTPGPPSMRGKAVFAADRAAA